jgi:uncharacterized protein with HEPN domain
MELNKTIYLIEKMMWKNISSTLTLLGRAVERIMEMLKRDSLQIVTFSHDADSSTTQIVKKYFPTAIEQLDVGHAAKNLKKRIIESSHQERFAQLRGFGERVQRDFRTILKTWKGSPEMIKMKILNMAKHYSGLHQDCDHGEDFTANYQSLTNSEAIFEMERILSSYAALADRYQEACSTNALESFNRSIVTAIPKNLDESVSYSRQANQAVLQKMKESSFDLKFFRKEA